MTEARFGVLTNGLVYRFFTDLENSNKMDETPFFEFNILDFKERDVEELKKFAKAAFDVGNILNTATELKYMRVMQSKLAEWSLNPSDEVVRLLSADLIGNRKFISPLKDQFAALARRAFEQLISERINERLKVAMTPEIIVAPVVQQPPVELPAESGSGIVTTEEEMAGFQIVRAILRDTVSPKRVYMRDAQSYCAILLDDNNRKPICRLRFNNVEKLVVGIFSVEKEEERVALKSVDDLFEHADSLRMAVGQYLIQN